MKNSTDANLTIGRLARAAEVNVETVRYYQRRGLIRKPTRPLGSIRFYSFEDVRRIRFIRRAQQLGFTLAEITNLLSFQDGRSCAATKRLAEQKLVLVKKRIDDLERLGKTLHALIGSCSSGRGRVTCPIIENLLAET